MTPLISQNLRFKTKPILIGLIGLLFLPATVHPQPANYTVSWMGVPVVNVTIQSVEDERGDYTEYQAKTRAWFDHIYSVDNRYRIWVDEITEKPLRYEKRIYERGIRDSLWARYDLVNPSAIIYSNGVERLWTHDGHTLFSALLWVQRHNWELHEQRIMPVEVEGVIWEVELGCHSKERSDNDNRETAEISVNILEQLEGEPVLGTTDILTYMLPGKGHHLRFAVDVEQDLILWAEFGSWPLIVRADLDREPDRH